MSKSRIKNWQRALQTKGLYSGEIDGDFGRGTSRASFELINVPETWSETPPPSPDTLTMANQNAIRNKTITTDLMKKIILAIGKVYGGTTRAVVYSGGQDRKGQGNRRTGSVRHDDFGAGGRAADCYIYVAGAKIFGLELAKLGQYWLAKGYGACGLEMATGGIHLDEWTTPPKGGGMFWTYKYSDRKPWGAEAKRMLARGARGEMP